MDSIPEDGGPLPERCPKLPQNPKPISEMTRYEFLYEIRRRRMVAWSQKFHAHPESVKRLLERDLSLKEHDQSNFFALIDETVRNVELEQRQDLNIKRRRGLKKSQGSFTSLDWEKLCEDYDYKCACCKQELPLTIDHIVPVSLNGSNCISNIQPLCRSCNSRKGNKATDYRRKS